MLTSPLLPIFLTVFVDVLGLTIVLPLLPYYAEHFGAAPLTVTLLAASYATCQLFSGPVLGRLSDRIGRKPVLLASQFGTFIGFCVLASASSLWMLFLGRIIDGSTAGNLSIAQAYISDVTRPENRTRAFGVIGIAFGTGFLIGPGLSGLVADRFGLAAPMYLAAALSLTSVVTTAALLPKPIPLAPGAAADDGAPPVARRSLSFGGYFSRPGPRRHLLEFACFVFSFATLVGGLALFLERRNHFDIKHTAYVYTLSGFVGAMVQGGLIGKLVKRFGEGRLATAGFAAMAVGYAALAFEDAVPLLVVATVIAGLGVAVVRPCLTTLITKSVGRHEQGAVLGVSQSLTSLSSMTANPLSGLLFEHGLLAAWALVASGVAALGVVLRLRPDAPVSGAKTEPAA